MSDPLVSIVVNNYNYERFLRDAIDSALEQTYAHCEVIVVDDGSTDGSREIIESYGTRIRPVLKSNGGQGSAFNAGFAAARGSLIAFLDSDDTFLPRKIERCVRAAAANPNAQLLYHQVQTVDANGAITGKPYPPRLDRGDISRRVQRGGGQWLYSPTSGQVFRREFLERIFPMDEERYRTSADAYVACLAGMMTEVFGMEEVLAHYRVHGNNAWLSGGGSNRDDTLRHHIRRFEIESEGLNEALRRLGSPLRVRLHDNFTYHICLTQTGRAASALWLLWLAARDRYEHRTRFRAMAATFASLLRLRLSERNEAAKTT